MRTPWQKESENRRRRNKRWMERVGTTNVKQIHFERLMNYLPLIQEAGELDWADLRASVLDGRPPGSVLGQQYMTDIGLQVAAGQVPKEELEQVREDGLPIGYTPQKPGEEDGFQYPIPIDGEIRLFACDATWYFQRYIPRLPKEIRDGLYQLHMNNLEDGTGRIDIPPPPIPPPPAPKAEEIDIFAPEVKE